MDITSLLRGVLGLIILIGISFLLSNNKKKINWKLVASGIILQIIFAILILKGEILSSIFKPFGWPKDFFYWVSGFFIYILNFTAEGAKFVFGPLGISPGQSGSLGSIFAFQVLPTIIFYASLTSILYYLGILQRVVQGMAWIMAKIMGTSGAESLSVTANIFVGQTEAPLFIKPFIKSMTSSEILAIMIGGMAHISGGVMAVYIQILGNSYAQAGNIPLAEAQQMFATQLLGASVMAAPAALLIAKILFPETAEPETKGEVKLSTDKPGSNVVEAAANGAGEGLWLALNVGGMLIAFIAIIALINYLLNQLGDFTGWNSYLIKNFGQPLNFQLIIGLMLRYLIFGIGVPWKDSLQFGSLLGTKIVLNEFVAYLEMGKLLVSKSLTDGKTIIMATYALCGFANFSSIAILIGGIGPLAPNKRSEIAKFGIKAVIGGTIASLMTASLAGILY